MIINTGDILKVSSGIICHQVNCKGKMGAGIALAIRRKWSVVYHDYMQNYRNGKLELGHVILSMVIPDQLYVASLCGQDKYGRDRRYTSYKAVRKCLNKVVSYEELFSPIYIPMGMGCSLAGGDWNKMIKIIEEIIPNAIIIEKK